MQGLSEPLGALMALLSIRPFLTPMRLQYMLAFVGGVMVSCVCLQRVVYPSPFILLTYKYVWDFGQAQGGAALLELHQMFAML